ncbi:hypothetical protein [Nostoc sp. CMAA1605]|uniref:hypothetical protein n=1 Tax=Nostoc sp. CMAA1605 TaxID=2055159 RepID=UPI001F3C1B49|nr:hypothetical protein [Nostoc sp. CMAA1605]
MTSSVEKGCEQSVKIPLLESGDRLTRHEFEHRYTASLNSPAHQNLIQQLSQLS